MTLLAFILAVVAGVIFAVEFAQRRSWIALGLSVLTVAWIAQLTVDPGGNLITF